jgi:hypothetical protein
VVVCKFHKRLVLQNSIEFTVEKILEIENFFDVNSVKYDLVNLWPLIRLEIAWCIMRGARYKAPMINSINGLKKKSLENEQRFQKWIDKLNVKNGIDFLILSNENHNHNIVVDNKQYNKHTDTFYDLVKDEYEALIMSFIKYDEDYVHREDKIDMNIIDEMVRIQSLISYAEREVQIKHFDELFLFLERKNIFIDKEYLYYAISKLLTATKVLTQVFKKISPKAIVMYNYYSNFNMASVLAAYNCHITSIELQHGRQHQSHFMNTHWSVIPTNGYALLPTYFFTWDDEDNDNISFWSKKTTLHKVFTSGDLFLAAFAKVVKPDHNKLIKFYPKDKIHILLSLQFEKWYSDEITKAINSASNKYYWHIKTHPRYDKDIYKRRIEPLLMDEKKVEYKFSNSVSFYSIAQKIDINITHSSSTAIELLKINKIPTILVLDNSAEHGMKHRNGFFYAQTSEEILQVLDYIIKNYKNIQKEINEEAFDKQVFYNYLSKNVLKNEGGK